jgi:RNA polymerase sigma-70 factor (ECF subfamily)
MDDKRIKQLLFERTEEVLAQVAHRYSRLYTCIIREILDDECDVEECANDVLLALWNSVPPNDPDNLSAYLCKLARRIGIDRLRYNRRGKRNGDRLLLLSELEDCVADGEAEDTSYEESKQIRQALSDFVRGLDPEMRVLFVRRYVYMEPVSSLAKRFQIKEGLLSVKLFRARSKLKKYLEKEGITL